LALVQARHSLALCLAAGCAPVGKLRRRHHLFAELNRIALDLGVHMVVNGLADEGFERQRCRTRNAR